VGFLRCFDRFFWRRKRICGIVKALAFRAGLVVLNCDSGDFYEKHELKINKRMKNRIVR
jgi:hypothetical protein